MLRSKTLGLAFTLVCSFAQAVELTEIRTTFNQGTIASFNEGETTPFIGARGDFFIRDWLVEPQAELSVVVPGSKLQNQPRLAFGAALRLDVLEVVPFVAARVGIPVRTDDQTYVMMSVGMERLYRNAWFWLLEMGAQIDSSDSAPQGVFIFGFGVTYSLDELV